MTLRAWDRRKLSITTRATQEDRNQADRKQGSVTPENCRNADDRTADTRGRVAGKKRKREQERGNNSMQKMIEDRGRGREPGTESGTEAGREEKSRPRKAKGTEQEGSRKSDGPRAEKRKTPRARTAAENEAEKEDDRFRLETA